MKSIFPLLTVAAIFATPTFADCNFESQIEVLALNMYHEARGEGIDGMLMVAEVTLNRVNSTRYPNTICKVVYQRRQFSWTHMIRDQTPTETDLWDVAYELSRQILNSEIDLFDTGATHFINPERVKRIPSWTKTYTLIGQVGNHVFYEMN